MARAFELPTVCGAQQAKPADLREAAGEHVLQKAREKRGDGERDSMMRQLLAPVALILICGCLHNQRHAASSSIDEITQANCTRVIADTAQLRSIVNVPGRRDSLEALCRSARARQQRTSSAPGMFSDSALHAEQCAPIQASEDWRRVCVPRDQRLIIPPRQP